MPASALPTFVASILKHKRASAHAEDLKDRIVRYLKGNPFGHEIREDPDTEEQFVLLRLTTRIPDEWPCIVGDIIHNLRSSLDVLATDLARRNGANSKKKVSETYFPIAADRRSFDQKLKRQARHLAQEDRRILHELRPYGDGNLLWKLHRLSVHDKHGAIAVVACGVKDGLYMTMPIARTGPTEFTWRAPGTLIEGGDVVMRWRGCLGERNPDAGMRLHIAFGQGTPVEGEPVIELIDALVGKVGRTIEAFM